MPSPGMMAPRVMGILNVTPDSFSDGGRFLDPRAAIAHGEDLIAAGAAILDIGGESTRPGAAPVSEAEEIDRVAPVIEGLRHAGAQISIDTMKPAVARAAMAAGASMWNDVAALREDGALQAAATLNCEVVLMHMQGEPRTMQAAPHYDDVVAEVGAFLLQRAHTAMAAGVARERIWLDPGIGFGKSALHNLTLLRGLNAFVALGFPVLLGASRKSFLKAIDAAAADPSQRLGGSLACALHAATAGVAAVRVHDVRETAQALKLWEMLG